MTETTTPLTFDRAALCVRRAAHRDVTRYAMHGVALDGRGWTATDGKILAHVTHETPHERGLVVFDSQSINALMAAMGTKSTATLGPEFWREMVPVGKTMRAADVIDVGIHAPRKGKPGNVTLVATEGQFPPYEDVLPDHKRQSSFRGPVSLDVLERLCDTIGGAARVTLYGITPDLDGLRAEARTPEMATVVWTHGVVADEPAGPACIGLDTTLLARLCKVARDFGADVVEVDWPDVVEVDWPDAPIKPVVAPIKPVVMRAQRAGSRVRPGHGGNGRYLTLLQMPLNRG